MFENALSQITAAQNSGQDTDLSYIMSLPGLAAAPVVGALYSQLVAYHTERDGMLAGPWARAPTHPDVRRLDTLISSTEA